MLEGDGRFGMDDIQTMGIVNAMKTGDIRIDMLYAMCIPIFIRLIFFFGKMMWESEGFVVGWWNRWRNKYERTIVHKSIQNIWGNVMSVDSDIHNTVLIKAIQLYLHTHCKIDMKSAILDLTSMNAMDGRGSNSYDYDSDDDEASSEKTLVGVLSKYKVIKKSPHREWHCIGEFPSEGEDSTNLYPVDMFIKLQEEDGSTDGRGETRSNPKTTLTLCFRSTGKNAIDTFVNNAYKWYIKEMKKLEDNSRYLYELQTPNTKSGSAKSGNNSEEYGDGPASKSNIIYARYKLSDEKTFESLFFSQKKSLLSRMEHFMNKTGTYAIKGRPHKLGLLLHGPPGTGKTSLIKALAQYTGRSIINVPLCKISTNAELMSVFFDKKHYIMGEDVPVTLDFKDVIFVMEDVDASSKIVRARESNSGVANSGEDALTDHHHRNQNDSSQKKKSIFHMLLESTDEECQGLVKLLLEKSERLKKEATRSDTVRQMARRMGCIPGLEMVGVDGKIDDDDEAVESVNTLMEAYESIDKFLSNHAKALKSVLESGGSVDDNLVSTLLCEDDDGGAFNSSLSIMNIPKTLNYLDRDSSQRSNNEMKIDNIFEHPKRISRGVSHSGRQTSAVEKIQHDQGQLIPPEMAELYGPLLFGSKKEEKDKLNLSGLLNVLDGVVDTPGRIVIMTTNHPEMLDPALRRPGRIDQTLYMGHMGALDVIDMVEHYFAVDLDEGHKVRLESIVNGDSGDLRVPLEITPAVVEQLTAENDGVEEFIRCLEEMSRVY